MHNIGTDPIFWLSLLLLAVLLAGIAAVVHYSIRQVTQKDFRKRLTASPIRTGVVAFWPVPILIAFVFAAFTGYGAGVTPPRHDTGKTSEQLQKQQAQEEKKRPDATPEVKEYDKDYSTIQEESDRLLQEKLEKNR